VLHSGRPTVVTVGVGAAAIGAPDDRPDTGRTATSTIAATAPAAPAASPRAEARTSTP
jgi:hypothetical protein